MPSRCYLKLYWHLQRTRTWSVSSEEDWKFALATNLTSSLLTFEIWSKLNFDVATALVYRECWNILIQRDWENSPHKVHFESGVRLGVGSFNLVTCLGLLISVRILNVILIQPIYADFFLQLISLLPQRILKLLEFIGFTGTRVRNSYLSLFILHRTFLFFCS